MNFPPRLHTNALYGIFLNRVSIALMFVANSAHAFTEASEQAPPAELRSDSEGETRSLAYPIKYVLFYQSVGMVYLTALDKEITGFDSFGFDTFEEGFKRGPEDDGDDALFNYILHPLWGSETYLRARSQNYDWWESFLFSTASSVLWEYGMENFVTHPSTPDLIITPIAGSVLGEIRYRWKRHLLQSDHAYSDVWAIAIDPIQSLTEFVGKSFGQDWREPAYQDVRENRNLSYLNIAPAISNDGHLGLNIRYEVQF